MCESPQWTPTVLIIDVKISSLKKVIKYRLRLIEALMALMRFFEIFSSEFKIPKYVYTTCSFQNTIMNSFDNFNTTKTLIKCNCFVYRNSIESLHTPLTAHRPSWHQKRAPLAGELASALGRILGSSHPNPERS